MPDGDLVKALREAGWGFFILIGIALGCVALAWRIFGGPSEQVQGYVEGGAIGCAVIGITLLVWRATAKNRMLGRFFAKRRMLSRFEKLTPKQRQTLVNIYNSGKRDFDVHKRVGRERYFEELVEWGFIESIPQIVYWSGQTDWPYELTIVGWEVVKKKIP